MGRFRLWVIHGPQGVIIRKKKLKGKEKKIKKWGFSGIKGTVRGRSKVFEVIFGHCPMILLL